MADPMLYLAMMGMGEAKGRLESGAELSSMAKGGWWNRAKAFGLGAISPDFVERQKVAKAKAEIAKTQQQLMDLAAGQTEAQRAVINRQLKDAIKGMNTQRAMSGSLRTGATIKDATELNRQATEAVASVSAQNALQAKLAGLGYEGDVKQFDLQLSQLEAAKRAGDSEAMGSIAEGIGSSGFLDKLLGLDTAEQAPSISANPEEMAGGTPSLDFPFNPEAMQPANSYYPAERGGFSIYDLTGVDPKAQQSITYNRPSGNTFVTDPYTGQDIEIGKLFEDMFQ